MKIMNKGKIVVGVAVGVIGLIFSGSTEAAVIAGTGPTNTWTVNDQANSPDGGAQIGENVTVPNSGGTLNDNWYLKTVTLSLRKSSGVQPIDVQVYLIAGTQVGGGAYADNSASAVASLTIPYADIDSAPLYGIATEYAFTSFSNPQGVITPGSYYLEFQAPGVTSWTLFARRDGGANTYAGGAEWFKTGSNIGVNSDFDTYFLLDGEPVNVVPEPSTFAFFVLGGVVLWRKLRHRA